MKRCILGCVSVAVVFACSVASVRADDIYPPPWLRGQPNTTYQDWTFTVHTNPAPPDLGVFNIYGLPNATINGGVWSYFYDNHVGVWTLGSSSSMDFYIPNTPVPNPEKIVWTQITWQPDNNGSPLVTVDGIASQLLLSAPVGKGGWLQNVYETILPFSPSSEDVIITGTMDVGQVVIDTECVPEPSSIVLLVLGLGAIGLLLPYASRKRRLAA